MVSCEQSHVETCWASPFDVFETLPAGGKESRRETMAG